MLIKDNLETICKNGYVYTFAPIIKESEQYDFDVYPILAPFLKEEDIRHRFFKIEKVYMDGVFYDIDTGKYFPAYRKDLNHIFIGKCGRSLNYTPSRVSDKNLKIKYACICTNLQTVLSDYWATRPEIEGIIEFYNTMALRNREEGV